MAANLGQTGFICAVRWKFFRASVAGSFGCWCGKGLDSVGSVHQEAEEIGSGVCSFSFSGKIYGIFCLNAKCTSCMQHVPARIVEFGVVTGDLVSEAKQLLNSDSELQCATASEPDRRRKGKTSRQPEAQCEAEREPFKQRGRGRAGNFSKKTAKAMARRGYAHPKAAKLEVAKGKRSSFPSQARRTASARRKSPTPSRSCLDSLKGGGVIPSGPC